MTPASTSIQAQGLNQKDEPILLSGGHVLRNSVPRLHFEMLGELTVLQSGAVVGVVLPYMLLSCSSYNNHNNNNNNYHYCCYYCFLAPTPTGILHARAFQL